MRLLRALPILVSATCVDYRLVGPALPAEPSLHVSVDVSHNEALTLALVGWFSTGTRAGATHRVLADSTMVLQNEVTPPEAGDASRLVYARIAHYYGDPAGPDSARVRGPIITMDAPPPTIALPVPRRLQPFRLEHTAGTDLILELSPTAVSDQLTWNFGFWRLEIELEMEDVMREVLSLTGNGLPPSRLHVPWDWLRQSVVPGDSLSATLSMFDRLEVTASPYRTDVSRQAQLFWRIRLVRAP